MIFVGLFTGLLVTPIWVIVERWLPSRGLARVAAAGVVAIGLGGRFGIEGDNFDFRILDPPLVQAAISFCWPGPQELRSCWPIGLSIDASPSPNRRRRREDGGC